ncbi:hypothetical protein ES707_19521 [subsurface metagenome]
MGLTMCERQAVTSQMAPKYRQTGKKKKGDLFEQIPESSCFNKF